VLCWRAESSLLYQRPTRIEQIHKRGCWNEKSIQRITRIKFHSSFVLSKILRFFKGKRNSPRSLRRCSGRRLVSRSAFVIQRKLERRQLVTAQTPNPTTSHLNSTWVPNTHRRITTAPDPSLAFTFTALVYLPTAFNDFLVPPRAHTVTSRSCFGNIPLLILRFTLSLSCVSQLRRSGRYLDALEPTDSFFYKHQASDHTPVGEDLLSFTLVVKDGRRGTELSNLEVHTVSILLILPRSSLPWVACPWTLRFGCSGTMMGRVLLRSTLLTYESDALVTREM